jgi:hypothetical protein
MAGDSIAPDGRGQAYTIEGVIGAILVASALVLGLQAVDIAPWTDDSVDEQTESLRAQVQDVLEAAADRGALRTAATCVDGDGTDRPHPAVAAGDAAADSERAVFGTLLNRSMDLQGHSYVVSLDYNASTGGGMESVTLTDSRSATRPSVTVTRQFALFDSDPVLRFREDAGECVPATSGETLAERDDSGGLYVSDQNEENELYAVVRVRVIAW